MDKLPPAIQQRILCYLDIKDFLNYTSVCKKTLEIKKKIFNDEFFNICEKNIQETKKIIQHIENFDNQKSSVSLNGLAKTDKSPTNRVKNQESFEKNIDGKNGLNGLKMAETLHRQNLQGQNSKKLQEHEKELKQLYIVKRDLFDKKTRSILTKTG